MLRTALLACVASAAAFAPGSVPLTRVSTRAAVARGPQMQEMSKAVPFLERPAKLDGTMPGDAGFDPLGFSDYYDVKWMQEAEIKHGRVCMLAALGMMFPEFGKFPQFSGMSTNPLEAFYQIGPVAWIQIFAFIGILETFSYEKIYYGDSPAGDLGFDPLRLSADPSSKAHYAAAEVRNGRLAMLGFSGMLHHSLLTKTGPIQQIMEQNYYPTGWTFSG